MELWTGRQEILMVGTVSWSNRGISPIGVGNAGLGLILGRSASLLAGPDGSSSAVAAGVRW
jgi:hypothetical protein